MININNCLHNCMYFPFAFWIIYWKSAMIQLSSYVFTSGSSQCNGLSLQKADEREQEGEQRDRERGILVNWSTHLWPIYLSDLALQQLSEFLIPCIVNLCSPRCPWPSWLGDYWMTWDEIYCHHRIHSQMCQGQSRPSKSSPKALTATWYIPPQPEEAKKPFTTRDQFIPIQTG